MWVRRQREDGGGEVGGGGRGGRGELLFHDTSKAAVRQGRRAEWRGGIYWESAVEPAAAAASTVTFMYVCLTVKSAAESSR